MTASNAAQYADSLLATITANADDHAPFGWTNSLTDEYTTDKPEGWTTDPERDDENCDYHAASAGDYLSDALDIRYVVNADRSYRSAQVAVTLGGPNAWLHLDDRELVVYWGGDTARRHLPAAFVDGLDDYLDDMWQASA